MKKIIIFDCDGVIIDSLETFMSGFISACKKLGYDQVSTKKSFLKLFDGNLYEGMKNADINRNDIPKILENLKTNLMQTQGEVKLFRGIKHTLIQLAELNKIYIITSNISSVVRNFLSSHGVKTFEEVIGAEKETSKVKKIESIKKKYPNHVYFYVGDTKGDMVEGRLADAQTIAVLWGWHDKNKLKEGNPSFTAKNPQELIKIIKNYK